MNSGLAGCLKDVVARLKFRVDSGLGLLLMQHHVEGGGKVEVRVHTTPFHDQPDAEHSARSGAL